MNRLRPIRAGFIALISSFGIIALWLERLSGSTFDQTLNIASSSLAADIAFVISAMTSPATVLAVVILSGIFAAYEHHTKIWWLLSSVLIFATALSTLLKQLLALPRPDTALIQLSSYGFPSTHATLATVLFIVGIWLYTWLEGKRSTWLTLIASLVWLAICASRITLGVHSLSDVLAGILLGAAVGVVAVSLTPSAFRHFRIRKFDFK